MLNKIFQYLSSQFAKLKKTQNQFIFALKRVQWQKIMPYAFTFLLALLILCLVVSELYFLILDIHHDLLIFKYDVWFPSYSIYGLIFKVFLKKSLSVSLRLIKDFLTTLLIHMEEFSKDPFWYLKVRYINWVHLVYKYYQWLWKFAWYQSFSKKIKPPFFKVLSYFINQTQFKKLFFKIVDLWVIYFKWLSHIRKDLGNFGFAFLWALLLTLCLIVIDLCYNKVKKTKSII